MRLRLWLKIAVIVFVGAAALFAYLFDQNTNAAFGVLFGWGVITAWIYYQLSGVEEVLGRATDLAEGRLPQRDLTPRGDELGEIARELNRVAHRQKAIRDRIAEITAGRLGAVEAEADVRRSGALAAADVESRSSDAPIDIELDNLTSHLRRLTIQARLMGNDQVDSSLLDERVPGELGDAVRTLVRSLRQFARRAKAISRGDLTLRLEGEGELAVAFNTLIESVTVLVDEITHTSLHISSSSEEILAVLRDQELSASHQASGVEETQRTMETLLSSAKKIAESAQTVFRSAEKTQANNRIVAQRIGELKTHTERIGEILNVIKSIADRSDLLALNASLEGMRAGDAGKGFTLVAAEMRRLAENIKGSVGDIEEMLSDIRESALSSVMATEEGTSLSEKTTESALKITLITQQQQSGTEQVTQSMEELSTLINQGVAGTQQVTLAASELVRMSGELREHVETYRVGTNRTSKSMRAARPGHRTAHGLPRREELAGARTSSTSLPAGMRGSRDRQATPVQTGEQPRPRAQAEPGERMDSPTMQLTSMDSDTERALLEEFTTGERASSIEDQIDALEAEIEARGLNAANEMNTPLPTKRAPETDESDDSSEISSAKTPRPDQKASDAVDD